MVSWQQFADQAPEFARYVRGRLEPFRHHVLGTLRSDGAPRLSGTEIQWRGTELELGSMPRALKALDLRRDPRCSIHSNPGDGELRPVDAKISGLAVEVIDPEEHGQWVTEVGPPSPDSHLFRLDISEVITAEIGEDQQHMLIKLWRPERGIVAFKRY